MVRSKENLKKYTSKENTLVVSSLAENLSKWPNRRLPQEKKAIPDY